MPLAWRPSRSVAHSSARNMNMTKLELWDRFQRFYQEYPTLGLATDFSRMDFPAGFLDQMEPAMQRAFASMDALEKGAIANPDENRMVGHYWLRNPALAPNESIVTEIGRTLSDIRSFAADVHAGKIKGAGVPLRMSSSSGSEARHWVHSLFQTPCATQVPTRWKSTISIILILMAWILCFKP